MRQSKLVPVASDEDPSVPMPAPDGWHWKMERAVWIEEPTWKLYLVEDGTGKMHEDLPFEKVEHPTDILAASRRYMSTLGNAQRMNQIMAAINGG